MMMHQHTEECLNGCTHLALQNQFLMGMFLYKEKQDREKLLNQQGEN